MHSKAGFRFSSRTSPSSPANDRPLWVVGGAFSISVGAFQHQYRADAVRSASMRSRIGLLSGICVGLKHVMSSAVI